MRVRYGKPIKAKSMLTYSGDRTLTTTTSDTYVNLFNNWNTASGIAKEFGPFTEEQITHTFFVYADFEYNSNFRFSYIGPYKNVSSTYKIKEGESLCSVFTPYGDKIDIFLYGSGFQTSLILKKHFVIDLTEIGLDNLTAQQFYNKYNKYFPLIATGEEITIDDKAGQVSLFPRLPSQYQEVEYIYQEKQFDSGTTNLAYIQSNLTFADIDAVEFDIAVHSAGGSMNNIVLCAYNTSYYIVVDKNKHAVNGYPSLTWEPSATDLFSDEQRHKVKVSGLSINNNLGLRTTWDWTWWHETYWYGLKFYKNNVLLQNLIPCYNKYTNDIGLFDLCGSRKNLCFRPTLSQYNYSKDYLKYNPDNAIYLEAGTYTFTATSLNGVYIQIFNPSDTSAPIAISNSTMTYSRASTAWNDLCLNVPSIASDNPITITLLNNYIVTICGRDSQSIYTVTNPQIEKGTTATTYEHSAFYINSGTGTFLKGNNVNNTLSCKIAGGSSDIYYGYNQKMSLSAGGANECSHTYDESTYEHILTANSSTTHTYFGMSCGDLSSLKGHKVLFIANITEISISSFSNINGEWAFTSSTITDRQRATTTGLTYCIGTWGNSAYTDYFNVSRSSGTFTQGDYFKTNYVQIIDLTEWFGEGKEPSTLAEFKEKFTKEYYGFCPTPIKLTRYQIEALPNYGYNQLYTFSTGSAKTNGVTVTRTTDAQGFPKLILNGTGTGGSNAGWGNSVPYLQDHIYYWGFTVSGTATKTATWSMQYRIQLSITAGTYNQTRFEKIQKVTRDASSSCTPLCKAGFGGIDETYNDFTFEKIMYIDLTDWYGAGNEPSTVAEFKATFPNLYYPFSKKRLLNKYMINSLIN